jgi:hypothetical protein
LGSAQEKDAGAGENNGPHAGQAEEMGCGRENGPRRKEFPFLFLFLIFQNHFSKDFQIQFEFDLKTHYKIPNAAA